LAFTSGPAACIASDKNAAATAKLAAMIGRLKDFLSRIVTPFAKLSRFKRPQQPAYDGNGFALEPLRLLDR
jgi:hypothetical protein